ncbi:MAG: TonB family protein [Gemmatimonadales bacterium]|jgi:TonB family protein
MRARRAKTDKTVADPRDETANERFKASFGAWLWGGVIVATVLHFALIEFFPPLTAADLSFGVTEFEAVSLPPEIEVPPAPEAIARPAVPVVARTVLEEDITIAPTTFEQNPVEALPAPPSSAARRLEEQPVFTPYTVAPSLRDPQRAVRIVQEKYPRILQDAGIGGTVVVWALIDERGVVKKCQVHTTCGEPMLDEAAQAAVLEFDFHPAYNYDKKVPVWISMPITFAVVDTG